MKLWEGVAFGRPCDREGNSQWVGPPNWQNISYGRGVGRRELREWRDGMRIGGRMVDPVGNQRERDVYLSKRMAQSRHPDGKIIFAHLPSEQRTKV